MRRRAWLGLVVVAAALAIGAAALRLQVAVPGDAAAVPIARTTLAGPTGPDPTEQPIPSDGVDLEPVADILAPQAGECLDRMTSGSGWLDLCWAAGRFGRDADPQKDYYLLRLYGSHQASAGPWSGASWSGSLASGSSTPGPMASTRARADRRPSACWCPCPR